MGCKTCHGLRHSKRACVHKNNLECNPNLYQFPQKGKEADLESIKHRLSMKKCNMLPKLLWEGALLDVEEQAKGQGERPVEELKEELREAKLWKFGQPIG